MANSKISALTSATTPLAGTETLPVVQSSATTKVTVANLTAGRAVSALSVTTTSDSTINSITVGKGAGAVSTNTVLGSGALTTNSTGSGNTVVGYQALYSNVTTNNNTAVGYLAGYSAIGISTIASDNTFIGARAGTSVTSGRKNTFIGNTIVSAGGCGSAVTTGNNNVIIGAYTGTAAPISATGSNYIVLSDGDGNVRQTIDSSGNVGIGGITSPAVKLDVLGTIQAAAAATQDAVRLAGRAGGTGTFAVTLTPTTLTASRTLTLPDATTTVVGTDATQTLTNKRIDPRVVSAASASSLTPSIATADIYAYTALAAGLTINAPTGTPVDGNKLTFRLLDNGTARALTWNATYTVIGVTLPTTTVVNKTTYVGCIYNANNTRWDVIAVATQA